MTAPNGTMEGAKTPRRCVNTPGPDTEGMTSMPEQDYKSCSQCGEDKPLDEFHRNSTSRDGRRSNCKECSAVSRRIWRETTAPTAASTTKNGTRS